MPAIAATPLRHRAISVDGRIFLGFVLTIPFLHALAVGVWLPVPMIYATLALIGYSLSGRAKDFIYLEARDYLLLGTVAFGIAAYVFQPGPVGQKNINHTAALLVSISVFYFWVRGWLRLARVNLEQIGLAATIALIIASSAVIVEFAMVNVAGSYLSDWIPYSTDELPVADVLTDLKRPRGLAAEPGFTAMVFEALAPLSWLYLRHRRRLVLPAALVVLSGFLLLFSAGAIVALCVAFGLILVLRGRTAAGWIVAATIAIAVGAVAVFTEGSGWLFEQVIGRKFLDLVGYGDEFVLAETASRYDAYTTAMAIFTARPFGIGWGTISEMFSSGALLPGIPRLNSRGVLSLYLEVLVSSGFIGFAMFLTFLYSNVRALARRKDVQAGCIFTALLLVLIHHAVVLEFWFPMFWFLLALSEYVANARQLESIGAVSNASGSPGSGAITSGSRDDQH